MSAGQLPHICTLATLFPNEVQPNFGIFVQRQCEALAARGEFRLTIINPIALPPWPLYAHSRYRPLSRLPQRENWHGLDVFRPRFTVIPGIGGRWNPALLSRAIKPLVARLHAENPIDLIDAEFFYPDGPAAMRLAADLGIAFSVKARGADIHHWGTQPGCAMQVLEAGREASGLLAVSNAIKRDMTALGMPADKITVHYTGIDKDRFYPRNRRQEKARLGLTGPVLISVGALIPRKGQDLVIRALADIPDATLLLAGSGSEELRYRALSDNLGVADRVRFLGAVPHDQLPCYISAADVAVLPSASEGLANAWVEALACGTPLVISDAGGASELLKEAAAGKIVRRDSVDIAVAVKSILASLPDQMIVAQTVSEFGWEKNAEQLSGHFKYLIKLDD